MVKLTHYLLARAPGKGTPSSKVCLLKVIGIDKGGERKGDSRWMYHPFGYQR